MANSSFTRDNYREAYLAVITRLMSSADILGYSTEQISRHANVVAHRVAKRFAERMDNFVVTMGDDSE